MDMLIGLLAPHGFAALGFCLLGTAFASYFCEGRGCLFCVLLLAVAYAILDIRWIRSEMSAPGWNGEPDQDGVFVLGVASRIGIGAAMLFVVHLATQFGRSRFAARSSN